MGQWIVGVISFQKIFGLCGLKGHKVEIMWDVTLVHGRTTTECEDRARILKQNSQYFTLCSKVRKNNLLCCQRCLRIIYFVVKCA